ncbi:MAG: hypothetical protein ABSG25_01935 [Bryobacteraceae bacterium]
MSASKSTESGFKRLTLENWLTVDPAWDGVVMSSSRPDPSEAWVYDLIRTDLNPGVPLPIRNLFETARGTLVYSLMFYPLLTLGAEQLFRVLEASASLKCKVMNAPPKINTFEKKVKWLAENGAITAEQQVRWKGVRIMRNEASHPKDQSIFSPCMALKILDKTVDLINPLF